MGGTPGEEPLVLHVDDDRRVLETTRAHLEREGFAVETETSATDALDRLATRHVDCIVSDYRMPGMDGLELLAAVRERDPDLPFVLFTGQGSEEVASEAIAAGVTDYLRKGGGRERYRLLANRIGNAVARRRAEVGYREIFENVADGIVIHDPETGNVVDVNRRFCELLGHDRETVRAMDIGDFSPDEPAYSREEARRRVRQTTAAGPQVFDWRVVTADGDRVPVEVHLGTTTIDGRRRVLATVRDVSERSRARHRLRAVVDHVPLAVYVKDIEGRYLLVNERAADLLGRSRDEVLGSRDADLFDDADADRIEAIDRRVTERGEPTSYERRTTIDGEERILCNEKFPYRDEDGSVVGLVGISEDVTDRRERERALQRQNERLEEFAGVLSHDLRNPLNVAMGHLDLLGSDDQHVTAAEDALDRIEHIIADVLTLTREGAGGADPRPVAFEEVVRAAWRTVPTADASLETDATRGAGRTVEADPDRLQRLLENLFANAVDHGGSGVTVRVETTADGFAVADDGPGIPRDERDRVFAPGYTSTQAGTGLGLAIVRDVADAHDWTADVTESASGGARFEFSGVSFADEDAAGEPGERADGDWPATDGWAAARGATERGDGEDVTSWGDGEDVTGRGDGEDATE